MRNTVLLAVLVVVFLSVPGCQQKKAEVTGWQAYTDDYFKVTFSYPAGWVLDNKTRQASIYSSPDAAQKFFDRDSRKQDGVQIIVAAEPGKTGKDAATYIQAYREEQKASGFTVKDAEPITIEGMVGSKVQFAGNFDEATRVTTIRAAVAKDSILYFVQYSAFNDLFEPYKMVFDSVVATLVLPRQIVVPKGVDPAIPFAEVQKFQSDVMTLEHPANFAAMTVALKGEQTYHIQILGSIEGFRRDCSMDISARPAKKWTVDKLAEQNVKVFKPTKQGESKIDGEKAIFFNYSIPQMKDVKSRVYFVVKNDKLYQVILNYFAPMEKHFLPPFEKVVASIRIK